jgi:hypothetical protein
VLCGFLSANAEARKKRAFFPEDIVDSDYVFHVSLLLDFGVVELDPQNSSAS